MLVTVQKISIHVPSWGTTTVQLAILLSYHYFNPRSLVGNDEPQRQLPSSKPPFQSTFPRGERRQYSWQSCFHTIISIHVPSWGTTDSVELVKQICKISIHVPSWGTTLHYNHHEYLDEYFNPRSLVGNDLHCSGLPETAVIFQSTFPRGERLKALTLYSSDCYFNPRSLVGNDCKFSQIFFVFLCNKYNFSTFYYPFSLFFSVIHVTFLIFVVRILPAFYVYF